MTSSEERQPRRRRGLIWLAVLLLALFGIYSAGWFWLADKVRSEATRTIAGLNGRGINADCANLAVSGYPLRFAVTCDSVAYQDDAHGVAASGGSVDASASILLPLSPSADVAGPLRTTAPGMKPLWLDWDRLQIGTLLWWPLPRRLTLTAEGLSGQTDPTDDSDPVSLFSAATAQAELRPDGQDLDYAGSFSDLEIDAEAIGGRTLPAFDASAGATVKNGVALLHSQAKSLRGQSVEIKNLDLSSGAAGLSATGSIAVDADGLIDADLKIRMRDPKAVGAILAAAIPEKQSQIEQGFAALAILGDAPSMPLKVTKGKASLGFIPLGNIKPVK